MEAFDVVAFAVLVSVFVCLAIGYRFSVRFGEKCIQLLLEDAFRIRGQTHFTSELFTEAEVVRFLRVHPGSLSNLRGYRQFLLSILHAADAAELRSISTMRKSLRLRLEELEEPTSDHESKSLIFRGNSLIVAIDLAVDRFRSPTTSRLLRSMRLMWAALRRNRRNAAWEFTRSFPDEPRSVQYLELRSEALVLSYALPPPDRDSELETYQDLKRRFIGRTVLKEFMREERERGGPTLLSPRRHSMRWPPRP